MPEGTLLAFANHGEIGPLLTADDNAEEMLARFTRSGIDIAALAGELQREGATSFVDSWNELIVGLAAKSQALRKAG
jgi:transaldolase